MTILERARELLARGFSVFPVPRPRLGVPDGEPGDGKTPTLAWKPYQTRLPTDDELVHWFRVPTNLAIATGVLSNLIVVDADAPDALRWCTAHLPYTPWQVQTARGFHLYYRPPSGRARAQSRPPRDVGWTARDRHPRRWRLRHCCRFGSRERRDLLRSGRLDARRRAVLLAWLAATTGPTSGAATREAARRRRHPRPRAEVSRRDSAAGEIGAGSDAATLYAACKLTRGFDLPASDAESLLWEWAGGRPGWTREWVAAKVQHAIRYGTEPIGALR